MALQPASTPPSATSHPSKPNVSRQPPPNITGGTRSRPADTTLPDGRLHVFVELSDPPVAVVYAEARAEPGITTIAIHAIAQSQLARIEAAQQALLPVLTGPPINATVLGRVQRVLNGIMIEVEADRLPEIRALPGVTAVRPLRVGRLQPSPAGSQRPDSDGKPGPDPAPGYPYEPPALE